VNEHPDDYPTTSYDEKDPRHEPATPEEIREWAESTMNEQEAERVIRE